MERIRGSGGLRVSLVAVAVVLVGCQASVSVSGDAKLPDSRGLRLGPFAGYIWHGPVHSVQAQWTVPQVAPHGPPGRAGTWIGAEAPSPAGDHPFIQLGVNEERREASGVSTNLYYGFWSDPTHHFRPVFLLPIRGGDRIAVALTLAHWRWRVVLEDQSTGTHVRFSTSDEGRGRFTLAEWLQEDITSARTGRPFLYPRLGTVGFQSLGVDGRPPTYGRLYAQWMSTQRGLLAPSPLGHDAFTLGPATLTAAGARYLQLARAPAAALSKFADDLDRSTPRTASGQMATAAAGVLAAVKGFSAGLRSERWPADAQLPVAAVIRANQRILELIESIGVRSPATVAERVRYRKDAAAGDEASHRLVRALHAPESTP